MDQVDQPHAELPRRKRILDRCISNFNLYASEMAALESRVRHLDAFPIHLRPDTYATDRAFFVRRGRDLVMYMHVLVDVAARLVPGHWDSPPIVLMNPMLDWLPSEKTQMDNLFHDWKRALLDEYVRSL